MLSGQVSGRATSVLSSRGAAPLPARRGGAAVVAAELGIDAPCFDVNSACTTFGMQLDLLNRMAADRLPPFVLICQPENITRSIDFSDRSTAVLFGDGSAAAVLSASVKARAAFGESRCGTNASAWEKVTIPPAGHFRQEGHAVQGFAIRRMTDSVLCLRSDPEENGRFRFIGHQVNLGALRTVCERGSREHWYNVDEFGNPVARVRRRFKRHWEELRRRPRGGLPRGASLTGFICC